MKARIRFPVHQKEGGILLDEACAFAKIAFPSEVAGPEK